MIDQIELNDFQCHKHLVLNLDKITTLVGPSDSGKSAVMRALDWTVFNNGKTSQLVRRGAKFASVTISVDGHSVTRTTKNNAYIIDGTELSSIGRSVPIDVPEIFRMDEDNIQRQHEYLFWFSATGSELTRNFNRVVDLTRLDEWVRLGTDTEKGHKQDVRFCDKRLEELDASVTGLLPFEELDHELSVIKTSYDVLVLRNEYLTTLDQICADVRESESVSRVWCGCFNTLSALLNQHDTLDRSKTLLSLFDELHHCGDLLSKHRVYFSLLSKLLMSYEDIENQKQVFVALLSCCLAYRDIEDRLGRLRVAASMEIPFDEMFSQRKELSELAQIVRYLQQDAPDPSPVLTSLEEFREVSLQLYEISTTVSAYRVNEEMILHLHDNLNDCRREFEAASEGVCPLCGNTEVHVHG